MAPNSEKDKKTKESIKTQKVTNASNLMSQLEPSAAKVTFLEYKIPNFSGTGIIFTPERRIPIKKEYEITSNVASRNRSNSKSG